MILAGNVALETMGFKTFGFGGGRADTGSPTGRQLGYRAEPGSRTTGATPATAISRTRSARSRWA